MWFQGMPTKCGWYFYAEKPKDWDFAKPVAVERVESPGQSPQFRVQMHDMGEWTPVEKFQTGIWFGPLEFPTPNAALTR